jgi:non-specific serine/threonine protein kinase/serine/threonine-protein kinase
MAMAATDSARKIRGGRLTPNRRRMLDRLLDQALEQPSVDRDDFVERCVERAPRLGFWLRRLLLASAEPTAFIDRSANHMAAAAVAARGEPFPTTLVRGTRLGPWRILARIGTGGMGEVYRAERADGAFEMPVAIKLIRSRRKNLARLLESERQMMARLNHGSIARLIDGGMSEDERPYIVMEWVDGQTLGEWIHGPDMTPRLCLDVFGQTCRAVAFAHRELVVHGDIKPANVAVARDGQVKLLDFGVSQLLDDKMDSRQPSALTPGFAAPEQLAGDPVSTASDIYSLGALLRWMVFASDPERPDERSELRAPWRGYRRLRDLDAIIERSTATDPDDRYATVNALLVDLERLASDRPVAARRLSPLGAGMLWVRRRKVVAMLGSLVAIALIGGMAGVLWQARIAAQERDVAQHEAAVSLAVKDKLILLFRDVSDLSSDSEDLTARELLDETAEAAGMWLSDDPETLIEVRLALAEILIALDDWRSAEPLLEQTVAEVDESSSPALRAKLNHNLAQVLHRRGAVDEGYERADRAVRMIESFSGDHAERLSNSLQTRGRLARLRGDWDAALADLQRARTLARRAATGPRPMMAWAEANLAATYVIGGEYERGVEHMVEAEALWAALGRDASPDALSNLQNLAVVLDRLGRTDKAARRFEDNIAIREARYGGSSALAATKSQYARLLIVRGEFERARELLGEASELMLRFVGENTPDYASTLIGHGELALATGDRSRAGAVFADAERIFETSLGSGHPYTLLARMKRAVAAPVEDRREALSGAIEALEQAGPVARAFVAEGLCEQAVRSIERGRTENARSRAERCLALRRELSLGGWRTAEAEALVALAGASRADFEDALERLAVEMSERHARLEWFRAQAVSP